MGLSSWFWYSATMIRVIPICHLSRLPGSDSTIEFFKPSDVDCLALMADAHRPEIMVFAPADTVETAGVVLAQDSILQVPRPAAIKQVEQSVVPSITVVMINIIRVLTMHKHPDDAMCVVITPIEGTFAIVIFCYGCEGRFACPCSIPSIGNVAGATTFPKWERPFRTGKPCQLTSHSIVFQAGFQQILGRQWFGLHQNTVYTVDTKIKLILSAQPDG